MSGFASMKKAANVVEEEPPEIVVLEQADLPGVTTMTPEARTGIWGEIKEAAGNSDHNHTFILAWGDEGTMKTGCVMDALTEADLKNNGCILAVDFDGGSAACRSAHHRDKLPHIRVLSPWVMSGEGRTTFDYPATHDRVMDIGRAAIEWAHKQQSSDYKGDRLKWFVVTGLDQWNEVATNCMKIIDLGSASDGISATVNAHQLVGNRWNWNIRYTRYHQLSAICTALMTLGVKVYLETHEQVVYENNKETLNSKPACEKNLVNKVNQIIRFERDEERDEDGSKTGVVNYQATFEKSKTNFNLQGQRRLIGVTREGAPGVFHGLPELSGDEL